MALSLKLVTTAPQWGIAVNKAGNKITVTDLTGEYDAANNAGGYGTPNDDLDNLALLLHAVRVPNSGVNTDLDIADGYVSVVYDATAANDKQTTWQFDYLEDGRHQYHIAAIQASTDDVNLKAGGAIPNSSYWYSVASDKIYARNASGVDTEVSDYDDIIDTNLDLTPTTQEWLHTKSISKYWGSNVYADYQIERLKKNPSEIDDWIDLQILFNDIAGAKYRFDSGLYTQGEDVIQGLITKFSIS